MSSAITFLHFQWNLILNLAAKIICLRLQSWLIQYTNHHEVATKKKKKRAKMSWSKRVDTHVKILLFKGEIYHLTTDVFIAYAFKRALSCLLLTEHITWNTFRFCISWSHRDVINFSFHEKESQEMFEKCVFTYQIAGRTEHHFWEKWHREEELCTMPAYCPQIDF